MTRAPQPEQNQTQHTFSQQQPPSAAPLEHMRNALEGPVGASAEEKWESSRAQGEAAVVTEEWAKAEFFWQAAVRAAESFPIRDPRLCKSLESLAEVYWKQAKYNMAEPLSRRVLGIYEAVLGKNHPDVGFVANNLGMLYHAQGNLKTAATLYERALPLLVAKLGAQHPSVFNLETNLKNVLMALGRTEDAEAVKMKLNAAQQKRWTRSGKFEVYSAAG
jgi:tetratricopeptide (TPR) repeat protein